MRGSIVVLVLSLCNDWEKPRNPFNPDSYSLWWVNGIVAFPPLLSGDLPHKDINAPDLEWWLAQELNTLAKVWATEFTCHLINFNTKFELTNKILMLLIMESNFDASLAELLIASTVTLESLPKMTFSQPLLWAHCIAHSFTFFWSTVGIHKVNAASLWHIGLIVANTSPKHGLQCMRKERRVDIARETICWWLFPKIALMNLHNFCTRPADALATILLNRLSLLPHPSSLVYKLIRPLFYVIPK